jgi:hypothetical protein
MSKISTAIVAALLVTGMACVTVNLNFNFPQKEMQEKLYKQEKELYGGGKPEEKPGEPEKKNNAAAFDPEIMLMAPQGDDKVDLKVSSPAIDKINESRKGRADKVKDAFKKGWIGEGNDGLVHEREAGSLAGKEKADFNKLVKAENDDREKLLKELLRANKLDDKAMDKVRAVWSRARKQACDEGWWIETKAGTWKKKTKEDHKTLEEGKDVEK